MNGETFDPSRIGFEKKLNNDTESDTSAAKALQRLGYDLKSANAELQRDPNGPMADLVRRANQEEGALRAAYGQPANFRPEPQRGPGLEAAPPQPKTPGEIARAKETYRTSQFLPSEPGQLDKAA